MRHFGSFVKTETPRYPALAKLNLRGIERAIPVTLSDEAQIMTVILQAGVSIFGLFNMDPALLIFSLAAIAFGGLNLIEYKRFD